MDWWAVGVHGRNPALTSTGLSLRQPRALGALPMRFALALTFVCCVVSLGSARAAPPDPSVPGCHGGPGRSGHYLAPGLTEQAAASLHPVAGFDGRVNGHVYAQPLYWGGGGGAHGMLIVATEDNE